MSKVQKHTRKILYMCLEADLITIKFKMIITHPRQTKNRSLNTI